jgi:hypothetical protein
MAPSLCPPVLQVKVAWEQDKELVSEEGSMVGRGLLGNIMTKILIMLRELPFGQHLEIPFGKAA